MSGHRETDELLSPIWIIVGMPELDCFLRDRISATTRNFITSGKSHVYVLAARRCSEAWFLCGNQAVADRIQCVAVGDLVLSQEDKPKCYRLAREISYETAILYSSVHRKIFTVISSSHASNDVMLSCCLKPIVSPVSLADKQRYRLQ